MIILDTSEVFVNYPIRLSRSADEVLQRLVKRIDKAIITSWWRHPELGGESGTPIEWLSSLDGGIIEVHCICSPQIAENAFQNARVIKATWMKQGNTMIWFRSLSS